MLRTAVIPDGFRYAEVIITNFSPRRIPRSGNITISINGSNLNISNATFTRVEVAEISCVINQETLSSLFVQCVAGSRPRHGTGSVIFLIDNSVSKSEDDFTYTEDPQVFSLTPNYVIRSGGIKVTFVGENLDIVPTVLDIDVVDIAISTTALEMCIMLIVQLSLIEN